MSDAENYDTLFRESLKEFRVAEDGKFSGICDTEEDVQQLLDKLKSLGFAYCVRDSHSTHAVNKSTKSFFFHQLDGRVPINFFGAAFSVENASHRECVLGPKYYKKKVVAVADHLEDHVNPRKKRLLIMDTKKTNCPATLDIKCIRVYFDYTIQKVDERWRKKSEVIKRLKKDVQLPNKPNSYLRYHIVASPASHHTHSTESVKASGNIHPLLAKEICDLVRNGTTSLPVIKLALDNVVKKYFGDNYTHTPDKMNTTFYPSEKAIYTHMYRALYEARKSVVDQVALQSQVDEWLKESSGNKIYFRPYKDDDGQVEPLLFCYQNRWQSDLLKKYGNGCLLDATYKTTKYEIPLFFITVRSNVGYLVVGFFFIQGEDTKSICEALEIFKGWNEGWNPSYWLTDYSESEINAIKQTFPQTKNYLCAFHRKQAWNRWIVRKGNLNKSDDEKPMLELWCKIAESPTEEVFFNHIEELKSNQMYNENKNAKRYFEKQWLDHCDMWVRAYEEKGYFDDISTTNGVETMNKILKHFYLKFNSDKSLLGVTKILVNSFLPSLLKKYCVKNSCVKTYNADVPVFLHKKTAKFVTHVMKRYSSAVTELSDRSVAMEGDGLFRVESSESRGHHYSVNFFEPSCTCPDFQEHKFPCKHFCAVFIQYPEWGFDKIRESYRNSPLICLDEFYGFGFSKSCVAHTWAVVDSEDVPVVSDMETDVNSQEIGNVQEINVQVSIPETSNTEAELRELRELCKYITNLSYNASDRQARQNALELLRTCARILESTNPDLDGLPLTVPSTSKQ